MITKITCQAFIFIYVRVAFDPEFDWNQEIADQIVQKKVSVGQLAKSISDFNTKYYTNGMGILFIVIMKVLSL